MQWGSENDKHNLQTGDQEVVSKPRTAYGFQHTKTKVFSTLLLGVPSIASLESFKVSLLAPKKTVMYTQKCKWLLPALNYPLCMLPTSCTPLSSALSRSPLPACFASIVCCDSGTCFILSFTSNEHHKGLLYSSFSPPSLP